MEWSMEVWKVWNYGSLGLSSYRLSSQLGCQLVLLVGLLLTLEQFKLRTGTHQESAAVPSAGSQCHSDGPVCQVGGTCLLMPRVSAADTSAGKAGI